MVPQFIIRIQNYSILRLHIFKKMSMNCQKPRRFRALSVCEYTGLPLGRCINVFCNLQVQSSLKSFADMTEYLPAELQSMAKYAQDLDTTDDTGRTIIKQDFIEVNHKVEYLFQYLKVCSSCSYSAHR